VITFTLSDEEAGNIILSTVKSQTLIISLLNIIITQGKVMDARVQEVLDAVAAEKLQVQTKLDDLGAQIQSLTDQLAAGTVVTTADLLAIKSAVENIFNPDPVSPAP
jgi:hypothetical protein